MAGTAYRAYGAPGRLSAAFAFAVVFPWGECPYLRREGRFRPAMADSMPCEPPSQACEVALCGPMMRGVALSGLLPSPLVWALNRLDGLR